MRSVLALVLLLGGVARAQDSISPRDLEGSSWGARRGEKLALDAKFVGYVDGEVRVAKVANGKLLLAAEERLAVELAKFRLGADKLDRQGRSNVRVTGTAIDQEGVGRALRVLSVVKLLDDLPAFAERAKGPGADLEALAREA